MQQFRNTIHSLLNTLTQKHPQEIDLSLERIHQALSYCNFSQKRLPPVIHIAGTNGKGSTIAFLRALLEEGGYRVHAYTSPHLVHFNERIRLNGQLITDDALEYYLQQVIECSNACPLTFFEATTLAAFLAFVEYPADVVLLETGMGGRLDATNVVEQPIATVITPIALDHQEFLGTTLKEIAYEKAGIIKRGCPVIVGQQPPEVFKVLKEEAFHKKAPLVCGKRDLSIRNVNLGLYGDHQYVNATLALHTLEALHPIFPLKQEHRIRGLETAVWPGRLHHLTKGEIVRHLPSGTELWLDGAHNEAAAATLIPLVKSWKDEGKQVVVGISMLKNRDCHAFCHLLHPFVDRWVFLGMPEHQRFHPLEVFNCVFAQAINCSDFIKNFNPPENDSRILITGSLYLVGEMLNINNTKPR